MPVTGVDGAAGAEKHGEVILLTDDPASVLDVPVFCAQENYDVETDLGDNGYSFIIRK